MKNTNHPIKTFKRQVNLLSFILLGLLVMAVLSSWQQVKLASNKNQEPTSYADTLEYNHTSAVEATDLIENQAPQEQPPANNNESIAHQTLNANLPGQTSTSQSKVVESSCDQQVKKQADSKYESATATENALHAAKLNYLSKLITATLEKTAEDTRHITVLQELETEYKANLKAANC